MVKMPERYKFGWLRELVDLVQSPEAATWQMCSETDTIADITPMLSAICMQLQKQHGGNMDAVKDSILKQLGTLSLLFII